VLGVLMDARSRIEEIVAPLIDGELTVSEDDRSVEVTNPSTGRHLLSIPAGCAADADRAVACARRAFADGRWSEQPPSYRKKVLFRFADLVAAESAAFDALDAGEMGKPISVTLANAAAAASLLRFYAESVDKISGDVYPSDAASIVLQRRVPRGVVAAVTPWNFPTYNAVLKFAPALAAGNAVVLKPSELSSRSAVRLGQLAITAGVPPGIFNVVPGLGETVGRALGLHMDVDMLTFTGSSAVGRQMLQYAGQSNMKVVVAECGGKSPHVVFDDGVDLSAAAESIARFLVTNQGQICSVGSRLLVQRDVEVELVERIAKCMRSIVIGDALDPKTTFGPLASANQYSRVMQYVEAATSEGAELVTGGRRASKPAGGYFMEPTIFRNVRPAAKLARDEIFGPVLAVIPFDEEADAIRLANDTAYGLSAYVWTASLSTGMRMAKGISCSVRLNAVAPRGEGAGYAVSSEPFGQSGVGVEGGLAGLETYLRRQRILINHA
jgi:acyl-CoA reductase-like NAD-dependent aldehyde dehydrogenase